MSRAQLICQIYDFLYKVLEHQGFAKNGVVICPDADNNKKVQSKLPLIQTSTKAANSKKPRVHSPKTSTMQQVQKDKQIQKMLQLTMEDIESITTTETKPFITTFHKH